MVNLFPFLESLVVVFTKSWGEGVATLTLQKPRFPAEGSGCSGRLQLLLTTVVKGGVSPQVTFLCKSVYLLQGSDGQ